MTQHEFTRRLQNALRRRMSRKEVLAALEDYSGFFAEGVAEGRSESDICAELGTPENIAAELAAELGKEPLIKPAWLMNVSIGILIAVMVFSGAVIAGGGLTGNSTLLWTLLLVVSLTAVYCALLWKSLQNPKPLEKAHLRSFWVMHGLLAVLAVCYYVFSRLVYREFPLGDSGHFTSAISKSIPGLNLAWHELGTLLVLALLLCVCLWSVRMVQKSSAWFMTALPHAIGTLYYAMMCLNIASYHGQQSNHWLDVTPYTLIYAFGLLTAGGVALLLRWLATSPPPVRRGRVLCGFALAALMIFCGLLSQDNSMPMEGLLLVELISAALLWGVMGGDWSWLPQGARRKLGVGFWLGHVGVAALVALFHTGLQMMSTYPERSVDFAINVLGHLPYGAEFPYHVGTALLLALVFCAVRGVYRRSPLYFTLAVHALCGLAYIHQSVDLLGKLSDPAWLPDAMVYMLWTYAAGLVLVAASAVFVRVLERRAK